MQLIIALSVAAEVVLVIAAWYVIRRRPVQPAWRFHTARISLILLSGASGAFIFHLLSGLFEWSYLARGPFDRFVGVCFAATVLAVLLSAFAKGFVRFAIASAGIVVAYLWLLVAAWSWM